MTPDNGRLGYFSGIGRPVMKFWAIQAFYCISGIGFFIQDLFDKVP